MRTKKYFGILTAICFSLCLAGCGEAFPELTDDEYNQTVEFAVGLLMKYSNNGQAKLTYVDAKEVTKQREKEAALAEKEKDKETSKPAPQPVQEPVKEPEPIHITFSGSLTLFKLKQFSKTALLIQITFLGISTFVKHLHPQNA